ncbi:MAG TPA: hypothetical protein VG324_23250, partial [Blastocatellia bacterium]|nr:hypothetical protein [Blastocatellia bacterium]
MFKPRRNEELEDGRRSRIEDRGSKIASRAWARSSILDPRSSVFNFWLPLVISSILLFSSLHMGGLSGYDDAFYASYGKQMILSGDWWSLRLNGYRVFEFPPMFPWLEALSMKVFGITDFAA